MDIQQQQQSQQQQQQQQLLLPPDASPPFFDDAEEDDRVQILVCGTSNEGTITDFAREHQHRGPSFLAASGTATAALLQGSNAVNPPSKIPRLENNSVSSSTTGAIITGEGGSVEAFDGAEAAAAEAGIEGVLDFDEKTALVPQTFSSASQGFAAAGEGWLQNEAPPTVTAEGGGGRSATQQQQTAGGTNVADMLTTATAEGRVVMDWEVTRDRKWVYARDQSQWFNYGFDERSFKEYIQRQLDTRLERLEHRSVLFPCDETQQLPAVSAAAIAANAGVVTAPIKSSEFDKLRKPAGKDQLQKPQL